MRGWVCGLIALGMTVAIVGCGGASGKADGKVTLKGKGVPNAEISFASVDDPTTTVHGSTGPDGTYYLSYLNGGLPPGKYTVTITNYTLPNGKPLPDGEAGEALRGDDTKSLRHAFTFDRTLTAGANAMDFELTEGKRQTGAN